MSTKVFRNIMVHADQEDGSTNDDHERSSKAMARCSLEVTSCYRENATKSPSAHDVNIMKKRDPRKNRKTGPASGL